MRKKEKILLPAGGLVSNKILYINFLRMKMKTLNYVPKFIY